VIKLAFALFLVSLPAAAKKDLVWTPAVVESTFRESFDGRDYRPYVAVGPMANISVRESIYIDAGEWLYHVTQTVHSNGMLNFHDGARIEVALDGKHLILRYGGKQRRLAIDQKSRGKKGAVIR
jgi:hypothetical protein